MDVSFDPHDGLLTLSAKGDEDVKTLELIEQYRFQTFYISRVDKERVDSKSPMRTEDIEFSPDKND